MHVTNVLSSHYDGSFTSKLLSSFKEGLKTAGHGETTFDLYGDGFDPVMKGDDFNQFFDKPLTPELVQIHDVMRQSEALTMFYPVWWNDMPAIIKGWIDRVFSKGFAYDVVDGQKQGLLTINKVILVCTLGNKKEDVDDRLEESMRIKEELGVFKYCGIPEVEHHFLYDVDGGGEIRRRYCDQIQALGASL